MKMYISGRMKDVKDVDIVFASAGIRAKNKYPEYEIINPCNLYPACKNPLYKDFMANDIIELLKCDAIYMMIGWEESEGATCEWTIAKTLGLKIL